MMSRNSFAFLFLFVLLVGVIFWYQDRLYRTPVSVPVQETRTIVLGTSHKDDIPAMDEPVFESLAAADVYLSDAGYGIVVTGGRSVRFYPFQILVWHEAVNDRVNGRDLLVTYDPLTYTSAVYDRTDTFGISGKRWNSNTLLYDRTTETLWSQLSGVAIEGTLKGTTLTRYPSNMMTWSQYKTSYPFGQVLSRTTGFDRDYTQDPYEGYHESQAIWFPLDREDTRLAPKSLVYGLAQGDTSMAFPVDRVEEFDTIQALVGEEAVLVPAYWFAWVSQFPDTQIYLAHD